MAKELVNLTFDELIEMYKERFNDGPPLMNYELQEQYDLMLRALETGEPMKQVEVPEGALI